MRDSREGKARLRRSRLSICWNEIPGGRAEDGKLRQLATRPEAGSEKTQEHRVAWKMHFGSCRLFGECRPGEGWFDAVFGNTHRPCTVILTKNGRSAGCGVTLATLAQCHVSDTKSTIEGTHRVYPNQQYLRYMGLKTTWLHSEAVQCEKYDGARASSAASRLKQGLPSRSRR